MRKLTDNAKTSSGLSQWYPMTLATAPSIAKTAAYVILPSEMGSNFTNAGASGTLAFTLPSAARVPNQTVKCACLAAQILRPTPVTGEKIYLNGSGIASKYVNIAGVIGNFVDLFSDGTDWHVTYVAGVITKEA